MELYLNEFIDYRYVDLDGIPVKKTREKYHYSYDPYVLWKGKYHKGKSHAVYSDRLMQWDYDKFNNCCEKVWNNYGQYFDDRQPKDIEKFLCEYLGKKIKLTAVMEGCNVSNGYPYWIFYYEK